MNIHGLEKWEIVSDLYFLLNRSMQAGICSFTPDRDVGISSNALVRFAYLGHLYEPKENEYPCDKADMRACEEAFEKLPQHRRTKEVQELLNKYWSKLQPTDR